MICKLNKWVEKQQAFVKELSGRYSSSHPVMKLEIAELNALICLKEKYENAYKEG